jgi:hypothetical protein
VPVALFPSSGSFPSVTARSASTSAFSRPARLLLALQPAHSRSHLMTLSTGGFSRVVAFPTAPIATGWSDPCRKGLAPSQELCLSTAHGYGFASNPPYGPMQSSWRRFSSALSLIAPRRMRAPGSGLSWRGSALSLHLVWRALSSIEGWVPGCSGSTRQFLALRARCWQRRQRLRTLIRSSRTTRNARCRWSARIKP